MTGNSYSLNNATLFVGDLSIFCTENDLLMLFSNFGAIPKVQIKRGKQGEALQYGFVVLPQSVAIIAAERVNGTKLLGRRLRIKFKLSHDSPSIICQERNRNDWVQIHFSFLTHQVTHAIGEEMLDFVFSRIGAVADVAIKQHSIAMDPPRQTAYGFVFFYEVEAAQRAVQEMKHVQIDGVMFDCNWSNKRYEDADARRKFIARQQKANCVPGLPYQQGSPQFTPARRSHSASPIMTGLGYDLAMAMEGLTMGLAGLTRTNQPMMMNGVYGPPLPPSPMNLGFGLNMNDGTSYYPPHRQMSPQQPQLGGGMNMGLVSPQISPQSVAANHISFFPPPSPPHMPSASTDSFTSYTKTMSLKPEVSARHTPMMDGGSMLHMVPPPPPLQLPRYHLNHQVRHLPSSAGEGYLSGGGIAFSGCATAPAFASGIAPILSATNFASSLPRPIGSAY